MKKNYDTPIMYMTLVYTEDVLYASNNGDVKDPYDKIDGWFGKGGELL